MPEQEPFSLSKFLGGVFNWRNHIKLIVFILVALVWFCVYTTVRSYWSSKVQRPNTINAGGNVDNSTKRNFWSLLEFNFGGQNK